MPISGYFNNSASDLAVALKPRANWAAREQQKQQELQYGNILEARARQDAQESQAAVQGQMDFVNQVRAMPLEAPDKIKVAGFVDSQLSDIIKNIDKNYQGNARKFFETEGNIALTQLKNNLLNSPVFIQAQSNKAQMEAIRDAMNKQQELVGEFTPDGKYKSAQQAILDYQNGLTDRVNFNGSYDPTKVNAAEYFGKQYAPGGSKFVRQAVTDEEKAAYAMQELGANAGRDYYQKSLAGRKVFYKTDPIEDQTLFNLKVADQKLGMQLTRSQISENNAQAQKALADSLKEKNKADNSGRSYFERTLANPLASSAAATYNPQTGGATVIPQLGIPVSGLTTTVAGKPALVFNRFDNALADKYANSSLGVTEKEIKGKKAFSGTLPGILDTSGNGSFINLADVPHTISKSDNYIYTDGAAETGRLMKGATLPDRGWKYFEAFVTEDQANKSKNTPGFSVQGKELKTIYKTKATGKSPSKEVKGYVFKGYVPVTNLFNDPLTDQMATKTLSGQKAANEIFDQATAKQNAVFDWVPQPKVNQ